MTSLIFVTDKMNSAIMSYFLFLMCIAKSNGSRDEGKSKNMTLAIVSLEASDKEDDQNTEDSKHEDQINQRYAFIRDSSTVNSIL